MSTTGDWADDMLKLMAEHAAHICCEHDIHENYCLCCMDSCPNSEGFYDEAEEHTGDDDDEILPWDEGPFDAEMHAWRDCL